jgi:hypothetical protein
MAFLHIKFLRAGQSDPQIMARFKIVSDVLNEDATVNLTFDENQLQIRDIGATLTAL